MCPFDDLKSPFMTRSTSAVVRLYDSGLEGPGPMTSPVGECESIISEIHAVTFSSGSKAPAFYDDDVASQSDQGVSDIVCEGIHIIDEYDFPRLDFLSTLLADTSPLIS